MPDRYEQQKFDWSGPTADPLQSTLGLAPKKLFVLKANQIRSESKIDGPPFDPYEYAKALGVKVKEVEKLRMDGLLKRTQSGAFLVHLKKEASRFRKNFTLAHELAHTFYYNHLMKHSVRFRGNRTADPEEEFLCNLGASELLMPTEIFQRDLAKLTHDAAITPITLFQLSRLYQVSLQAVMIRCTALASNVVCAIWDKTGKAINLQWAAPRSIGRLVLCQTRRSSVELAFQARGEVITAIDSFYCRQKGNRMIRRKVSSFQLRTGSVISVLGPQSPSRKPARLSEGTDAWQDWWDH